MEAICGCDESLLSSIIARDLISLLLTKLKGRERAVFLGLLEQRSGKEIALELKISPPAVHKYHQHIQLVARKLGISPPTSKARSRKENIEHGNLEQMLTK